jgi:hypothetical protein
MYVEQIKQYIFLTQIYFCIPEIFKTFSPIFEWIHKDDLVVKKLVLNVRIKAFWYTNVIN